VAGYECESWIIDLLRIARQKEILDMSERPDKKVLYEVLRKVWGSGKATNEDCFEFRDAGNDAREFLSEESVKLDEILKALWELQMRGYERRGSGSPPSPQRREEVRAERLAIDEVERHYKEFPVIFRMA
jgi:hypothetical protein